MPEFRWGSRTLKQNTIYYTDTPRERMHYAKASISLASELRPRATRMVIYSQQII